jgi:hypothetical protein
MSQLSSARRRGFRWGWWGAAAAHVGGNMVRKSRTVNALGSAARVTAHSVAKAGRVLWLEVTGLFFVAFAAIGSLAAWHEYSKYKVVSGKLIAAICFMFLFAWFGLSSFQRARRKAGADSVRR